MNQLNPMNDLCLNVLHRKAFDKYLITISEDNYSIDTPSKLKSKESIESMYANFWKWEGKVMLLPDKFLPSRDFLLRHNGNFNS